MIALGHYLHLATICTWPFIHLAMLQTNLVMIALGHFFTWPTFDVPPLHLADIFHLDLNIKAWPYLLDQILLDQIILLDKLWPKEFFGPKERCGQVIRMAKRNDTLFKSRKKNFSNLSDEK